MKTFFTFLLFIAMAYGAFSQTSSKANLTFNSVITSKQAYPNFGLISNYYTLSNNIDNPQSAVYIADSPTLDQIEEAALFLPSDYFIVSRGQHMLSLLMFQNDPINAFVAIELTSERQALHPNKLKGTITENRANEIIKEQFDPAAKIENGFLYFNNKEFRIIPTIQVEKTAVALVKKEKLANL